MKRPRIDTPITPENHNGFSLIEVIVSITLLSFIMVLVIHTTDSSITTKEKILAEDQDILQAEMAIERMDLDFTQIYSPLYFSGPKAKKLGRGRNYYSQNNSQEEKTFPFKPSKNFPKETKHGYPVPRIDNDRGTLSFLTSSNRRKFEDIKQSNYAWVKYFLRNSTLKTDREELNAIKDLAPYELVRTFIAGDIYNRDFDWTKHKSHLLMRYVKKLKFQFWHSKRKKWVDRLRELPRKDAEVLRAVKITIVWVDKDKVENKVTRISRPLWPYYDTKNDSGQQQR